MESPFLPLLVVSKITPLAALEPYRAVAVASFNTVVDSMSEGSIPLKSEPKGIPSTTYSGARLEFKGDRIANKNPSELSKALTGEVAGVQVISTSGQPGSNASIRIRGLGSVNSSRAPLYVVDGIPFFTSFGGQQNYSIGSS